LEIKVKVLQNGAGEICYTIPADTPAMKRKLNTTINRSKNEKDDEHYTQLADIKNIVQQNGGHYA
jgi:hypothetical protein